MPILDAVQIFVFGVCLPSWDVYSDIGLIIKLFSPFICAPYSADEYMKRFPYLKYPERYNLNNWNKTFTRKLYSY